MTFDFKMPDKWKEFIGYFSVLNLDIMGSLHVDCLAIQPSLVQKFFLTQTFPVAVLCLLKVVEQWELHSKQAGNSSRKSEQEQLFDDRRV